MTVLAVFWISCFVLYPIMAMKCLALSHPEEEKELEMKLKIITHLDANTGF